MTKRFFAYAVVIVIIAISGMISGAEHVAQYRLKQLSHMEHTQ